MPAVRYGGAALSLCLLAACARDTRPALPREAAASRDANAPVAPLPLDASYDWHALLTMPFGTLVKDSPRPLHEVLLFQDAAQAIRKPDGRAPDGQDCYGVEGDPPRFAGARPDPYLLCFDHDRLARIEAEVEWPAAKAARTFARSCAQWLGDAAPATGSGTACEGRTGGIAFSARLAVMPGAATTRLSMTLTNGTGDATRGE